MRSSWNLRSVPQYFLDKQLEGLTIGEMAQFDQLSPIRPTQ